VADGRRTSDHIGDLSYEQFTLEARRHTGSVTNRRIQAKAGGINAFPPFVDGLLGES
jgi:hypothetical protein